MPFCISLTGYDEEGYRIPEARRSFNYVENKMEAFATPNKSFNNKHRTRKKVNI
jgi:hypothetical protein